MCVNDRDAIFTSSTSFYYGSGSKYSKWLVIPYVINRQLAATVIVKQRKLNDTIGMQKQRKSRHEIGVFPAGYNHCWCVRLAVRLTRCMFCPPA